jgi:threonine/homoserine/homoserine lactone efflux protein
MDLQTIISFLGASIALTFSPGPDNMYVLMQSITHGKKYGIATAFGLVLGIIIHTSLIAFGVSAIIQNSDNLFFAIKLIGAIYLLYLAYKLFRTSSEIDLDSSVVPKKKPVELIKQGFIMNVLNPKVTIFFLAFFPAFIDISRGNTKQQIFILGFLFMMQAFIIFSLISVVADKTTAFLRDNKKFSVILKWVQIMVFVGIAIFIIFS